MFLSRNAFVNAFFVDLLSLHKLFLFNTLNYYLIMSNCEGVFNCNPQHILIPFTIEMSKNFRNSSNF